MLLLAEPFVEKTSNSNRMPKEIQMVLFLAFSLFDCVFQVLKIIIIEGKIT